MSFTNLDSLLAPTCGADGVTTNNCLVSFSDLALPVDMYQFGVDILEDAQAVLSLDLLCLNEDIAALAASIDAIALLLNTGLPVSVTVAGTTTPTVLLPVVIATC